MNVGIQPILKFEGINIVNLDVKQIAPLNPTEEAPIDLTIIPKVFFPDNNSSNFTIIIELKIGSKNYFDISIVAFGNFSLNKSVNEPDSKVFINTNAPAIMFPYVRSFLSTLTSNLGSGFAPIILPPHFFQGELEEFKPKVKEEKSTQ